MAKARVLTRLELAEHLGVDKQMVTKWARSGMPVHTRGRGVASRGALRLGWPMEARILGHEHAGPALDMVGGRPSLVGSSVTNGLLSSRDATVIETLRTVVAANPKMPGIY